MNLEIVVQMLNLCGSMGNIKKIGLPFSRVKKRKRVEKKFSSWKNLNHSKTETEVAVNCNVPNANR